MRNRPPSTAYGDGPPTVRNPDGSLSNVNTKTGATRTDGLENDTTLNSKGIDLEPLNHHKIHYCRQTTIQNLKNHVPIIYHMFIVKIMLNVIRLSNTFFDLETKYLST